MIFKVIILVGLLKLLIVTERPILCAGVYSGLRLILGLVFGEELIPDLIASAITFGLALLYFWLLNRFQGSSIFWLVLIVGLSIGLV